MSTERFNYVTPKVVFNLSAASISDTLWPKYFYPTNPSSSPYTTLRWSTNNWWGATLTVKGSGNFTSTIALGQLYWAKTPEPLTQNGQNPGGDWVSMTTMPATVDTSRGPGDDTTRLDYQFKWEYNDGAASTGCAVTLTYTLTGNW